MQIIQPNLPAAAQTVRAELATARTDAVLCDKYRSVFALSSGPPAVGAGHPAAKIFLDTVAQHTEVLTRSLAAVAAGKSDWKRTRTVFSGIFEAASETIRAAYGVANMPESSGTVMIAHGGACAVSHVGMTRGYIIRRGNIVRLTTDFRDQGGDNEERTMLAMSRVPSREQQAMGQRAPLQVDGVTFRLASGSTVVLVSEGIAGIIRGREILALAGQMPTIDGFAAALTRFANSRQVVADCSAVVVKIP